MGSYPISGRLWASFTAALCVGVVAGLHRLQPRNSLWTDFMRVVAGEGLSGHWLLDWVLLASMLVGLVGTAGTIAYAILAPATQLARRLTPPPASPQDADYDDGP
jgi:hypothetical protein